MPKIGIMRNNMPELPEVETVKNTILPLIKDKTIKKVTVFYDRLIQSDLETFKKEIINKKILNIQRYGKYLFFDLSDDYILIIHLRMEGKFSYNKNPLNARISSTTLIFNLDDNSTLSFNDTRKFGLMYLTTKKEIHSLPMMQKLGIEANKVEINDYPSLIKKLKRRKPIKELLLDQSILCGIGNIYADETLYRSKINPLTKGNELKDEQFIEIFKNAKIVLDKAIKLGGSTVHSFSSNGIDGKFQNELLCYGKVNEKCPNCGTRFHKIFLNGRGTTYCPNCQIDYSIKKAIGITGPIGSGKSTILKYLETKNYLTYSCDELIHSLYLEVYIKNKISKILGFNFDVNNDQNRKKAKELMNNNPLIKEKIENYIYPILEEKLTKIIKENENVAIEVPLLFKAHYEFLFKKIIVIEISNDKQKENLKLRNEKNIDSSLKLNSDYSYLKRDDVYVICNNSSLEELYSKIDQILA